MPPENDSLQGQHLLRILGVTFGIAVTLGGMIGLGILRTPGEVASRLGAVWLILGVWALGAVYALFGTFQAVELATLISRQTDRLGRAVEEILAAN